MTKILHSVSSVLLKSNKGNYEQFWVTSMLGSDFENRYFTDYMWCRFALAQKQFPRMVH